MSLHFPESAGGGRCERILPLHLDVCALGKEGVLPGGGSHLFLGRESPSVGVRVGLVGRERSSQAEGRIGASWAAHLCWGHVDFKSPLCLLPQGISVSCEFHPDPRVCHGGVKGAVSNELILGWNYVSFFLGDT